MIRLLNSFKQALLQIWRNKGMSLASTFAISAMLLILGLFLVVIINTNVMASAIKQDYNNIQIFLEDSVKQKQIDKMEQTLKEMDHVDTVTFRTKEEAMDILKKRWGDNGYLLDSISDNPLPNSFIITMTDLQYARDVADEVSKMKGVEDVTYYKDTVDKLLKITKVLQIAGMIIILFLIIVSVVVVSNTIKLTVMNRSEEIVIMKYVGATNWYIRGPFMLEGILLGALSAAISAGIVILVYAKLVGFFNAGISSVLSMPLVPVDFLSENLIWIFLALGISIGAWGSIVSMRRFLDT